MQTGHFALSIIARQVHHFKLAFNRLGQPHLQVRGFLGSAASEIFARALRRPVWYGEILTGSILWSDSLLDLMKIPNSSESFRYLLTSTYFLVRRSARLWKISLQAPGDTDMRRSEDTKTRLEDSMTRHPARTNTLLATWGLIALLWGGVPARAQYTTGSLAGTAADSTGAVIP